MRKALVFGASGQMARALVPMLAEQGWQVDAVTQAGRSLPPELAGHARLVVRRDGAVLVDEAIAGLKDLWKNGLARWY